MDVRNVLVIIFFNKNMVLITCRYWFSSGFDYLLTGVVFISGTVGALPVAFMAEILTLRTSGLNFECIPSEYSVNLINFLKHI